MGIFGYIDKSQYTIPGFLPNGQPLLLPEGSETSIEDKDGKWAFYINESLDMSWIALRARYKGVLGWKIYRFTTIVNIEYVKQYVKSCNQCLENF